MIVQTGLHFCCRAQSSSSDFGLLLAPERNTPAAGQVCERIAGRDGRSCRARGSSASAGTL
jgi:hypothetical protein